MSMILDKLLKGQKVEWLPLKDVANFKNGFAFKSELFIESGLPIIRITNIDGKNVNLSDTKYFNKSDYESNLDTFKVLKGDILIAMSGATTGKIGYYDYDDEAYLNQRVGKFLPKENILNNRYLYHFLLTKESSIYYSAGGGAQPNLSSNKLMEDIKIPIPPLDVQAKIVKILDAFTALTAELTAELTMREKQYHYYRDKLLTFSDDEVEWKALGDVVLPTKNIKWKETNLSYQYIDLSSVDRGNNNIGETLEITSKNAPSRAQKIVKQDDIIFATTRPTQMRVAIIPKNFDEQIASTGYCILRANQKEILPKWIYYNLSLDRFKFYLEENQSGVAYPAISDGIVKEFQIPIPSLKEQKRIIEILDNFEIFNHSITEGLPFEIALRQKQYEYYREQLLDFPKS